MEDKSYLSCAETAKLVRKALKDAFPGVKFSVKSHVYSGGASINVKWIDGPIEKEVEKVTGMFAGAGFDGMIDLKYYVSHWMLPDGTIMVAHDPGTVDNRGVHGSVDNPKPEGAKL